MASVLKRPESKYWIASFTHPDGRQLKRSTKTTNKKEAQKLADLMENEYRKVRTGAQMLKVMTDIHKDLTGSELKPVTFTEFRDTWLAGKTAEGVADSTLTFYKHSTKLFLEWLGPEAEAAMASITRAQIERFRNEIASKRSAKTTNHQIKALKMMFKAAVDAGAITENPTPAIKSVAAPRGSESRKAVFTLEQLAMVLAVCDEEWKRLIRFAYYTGQRLADLQYLRWESISSDCGNLEFTTRKTGRRMTIPLAPALQDLLLALNRPQKGKEFVHPTLAELKTNTVSGMFVDLLIKCGLRSKTSGGGGRDHTNLSFHSIRHCAVSTLKSTGASLTTSMEFIGHSSVAMSEHYSHAGADALRAAANSMPEV